MEPQVLYYLATNYKLGQSLKAEIKLKQNEYSPLSTFTAMPHATILQWLFLVTYKLSLSHQAIDWDFPNEREHNISKPEQGPEKIIVCNRITQLSFITANLKGFYL